jgi:hypothetical protein
MTTTAREFIDYWIENSVHAREHFGAAGAEQSVAELVRRLVQAARAQGVPEKAMCAEVGDLTDYVRSKLGDANRAEKDRQQQERGRAE